MTDQSVYDVLSAFIAGEIKMAELLKDFRRREWNAPAMSKEEILRGDDHTPPENDWALVEAHRQLGKLTDSEYEDLVKAVTGGGDAE